MVDWYKDYASKFGAVLNNNPSPGNVAGGLLNITIKSGPNKPYLFRHKNHKV